MHRAVVFAYHNIGVRCLKVLLACDLEVALVITHVDEPTEVIWFDSVAEAAADYDIPVVAPDDPNQPDLVRRIRDLAPDFLFSFYYRKMLAPELLAIPRYGALNMHGSLLPKYRGRAPINWAVLQGETETGATLHYMTVKPDAGDIVAQTAVPILLDDTAKEVFDKVAVAAELTLYQVLPDLLKGQAPRIRQNLRQGSYFSGRRPEDGWIDWCWPARRIHNLVRAVAPPYPGAFTTVADQPARVLRTRVVTSSYPCRQEPLLSLSREHAPERGGIALEVIEDRFFVPCVDGCWLRILALEVAGVRVTPAQLTARLGPSPWQLGEPPRTP